ncbi:MAG TPA: DUF6152 family protein [Bryobacteraceae bacterium]|nr:DUF6152 family protein [Bryobacteraceae bacterium]
MRKHKSRALVMAAVLCTVTAYAHHSLSATYYPEKEIKLEGKILDLLLRNPHSFLQIEAPDDKGVVQRWSLEWRSSGQLGQAGIKRDTLKVGDEVTITMNPSRTAGDHRGALKTLHRKSDGFGWGTNPGETIE